MGGREIEILLIEFFICYVVKLDFGNIIFYKLFKVYNKIIDWKNDIF